MEFALPKGEILPIGPAEVRYLDALLLENGRMKLHPAAFYHGLPKNHVRVWACLNARYGIPTTELVAWLRDQISGRTALEIGAGCGDLGYHLGVPMTDSYQQVEEATTVAYLAAFGQAPTKPPADVEREDAEAAVIRRKPQVVIGSWITERWIGGETGNIHGPMEENILPHCETYILIGNEKVHGKRRIMVRRHRAYKFDWLVSRAKVPAANVIYVWNK